MIDLRKIHEQEVFDVVGERVLTLAEIQPILTAFGFVLEDDFAWLMRSDRVEQWQTKSLVDCEFLAKGREVYPDESDFDSLRFSVLVSSLPREQVVTAIQVIFDITDRVRLVAFHDSRVMSRAEIPSLVAKWTAEIMSEAGDICGSESVAILIRMEYDKRRA